VAHRPVAERWLCKQRPFLNNGSVNTFRGNECARNNIVTGGNGVFLRGQCRDVISKGQSQLRGSVCVCVCVCVCECECEWMSERERECVCVCVCVWGWVWVNERERVCVCECECEWMRERERVCVCVNNAR
jgi:hypothetical protein